LGFFLNIHSFSTHWCDGLQTLLIPLEYRYGSYEAYDQILGSYGMLSKL